MNLQIIKQARSYVRGVLLANGGVGCTLTPDPSPARASQERGVINAKIYAEWLLEKTGADGVGIGQGALGRPWIFEQLSEPLINTESADYTDKKFIFKVVLRHAELAEKLKGKEGILEMRKHLCWYVNGMENASELRRELVKVESLADVKRVLKLF